MLCENCKKNSATFHYKYNENGNVYEAHLCADCAKKSEHFASLNFDNAGLFSTNGMFGDIFGPNDDLALFSNGFFGASGLKSKVCPSCGLSETELRRTGKLGCSKCYSAFENTVLAMLEKLQVSCEYKGKIPDTISESKAVSKKLKTLREELSQAVEMQEYEEAAKLRDSIRQLEGLNEK